VIVLLAVFKNNLPTDITVDFFAMIIAMASHYSALRARNAEGWIKKKLMAVRQE